MLDKCFILWYFRLKINPIVLLIVFARNLNECKIALKGLLIVCGRLLKSCRLACKSSLITKNQGSKMKKTSKNLKLDLSEFHHFVKNLKSKEKQQKFANEVVEVIAQKVYFEIRIRVPRAEKPYYSEIVGGNALYEPGSLGRHLYRYEKMPDEIKSGNTSEVKVSFHNSITNGYWGRLAAFLEYGTIYQPATGFFRNGVNSVKRQNLNIIVYNILEKRYKQFF